MPGILQRMPDSQWPPFSFSKHRRDFQWSSKEARLHAFQPFQVKSKSCKDARDSSEDVGLTVATVFLFFLNLRRDYSRIIEEVLPFHRSQQQQHRWRMPGILPRMPNAHGTRSRESTATVKQKSWKDARDSSEDARRSCCHFEFDSPTTTKSTNQRAPNGVRSPWLTFPLFLKKNFHLFFLSTSSVRKRATKAEKKRKTKDLLFIFVGRGRGFGECRKF